MSAKRIVADAEAVAAASNDISNESPPRLIDKNELLRRVPFTFPTIWKWMREKDVDGKPAFPCSRDTGGKTTWVESEIDNWIRTRPMKGDAEKKPRKAGAS
jgi:predicted DNA-binding transcriptional regulator AlpA